MTMQGTAVEQIRAWALEKLEEARRGERATVEWGIREFYGGQFSSASSLLVFLDSLPEPDYGDEEYPVWVRVIDEYSKYSGLTGVVMGPIEGDVFVDLKLKDHTGSHLNGLSFFWNQLERIAAPEGEADE